MNIRLFFLLIVTITLSFSQNRGFTIVNKTGKETGSFGTSWALIIGVNDYEEGEIPKLRYAVNDAQGIADLLIKEQGFEKEKVLTLINSNATKNHIIESFEFLKQNAEADDRIVVFFAGHGITLPTPGGREKGYILPVDARINSYSATCLSVDQLNEWSEQIRSKHIYFVMDACYGGTIFTRGTALSPDAQEYYEVITSRVARQAITAGGRDQQVMDTGDEGHSVFTYHFISGIKEGLADLNGDGIITAGEIASYVAPQVTASSKSQQTPEYGSIAGSKGGEFVFLAPETSYKKKPANVVQKPVNFNTLLEHENWISISVERILSTESSLQIGIKYPIDIQKLTKKSIVFSLVPNIFGLYFGKINSIDFSETVSPKDYHFNFGMMYIKGKFFYDVLEYNTLQCFAHFEISQSAFSSGGTIVIYQPDQVIVDKRVITMTDQPSQDITLLGVGLNFRLRLARLAFTADCSFIFDKDKKYYTFLNAVRYDGATRHSNINLGLGVEVLL